MRKAVDVVKSVTVIRKAPNKDSWTVYSESGKPMGTYDSLSGAKKRLMQIEYFKHKSDSVLEPEYINEPPKNIKVEIKRGRKLSIFYKLAQDCDCSVESYDGEYDSWSHIDEYEDDDLKEEKVQSIYSQIHNLFKNSGIRMMYKDEHDLICIDKQGKVLGVLVSHQDSVFDDDNGTSIVYFSIVTDKECQGKGIATKLIDYFINKNESNIIKSETYNRNLDGLLERRGFFEEYDEYSDEDSSIKFHVRLPRYLSKEDYLGVNN